MTDVGKGSPKLLHGDGVFIQASNFIGETNEKEAQDGPTVAVAIQHGVGRKRCCCLTNVVVRLHEGIECRPLEAVDHVGARVLPRVPWIMTIMGILCIQYKS